MFQKYLTQEVWRRLLAVLCEYFLRHKTNFGFLLIAPQIIHLASLTPVTSLEQLLISSWTAVGPFCCKNAPAREFSHGCAYRICVFDPSVLFHFSFFLLVWDFFLFFLFSRNKFRATTSTAPTEDTEQGSRDDVWQLELKGDDRPPDPHVLPGGP